MDRIAAVKTEIAQWLAGQLIPDDGRGRDMLAAEVGVKQGHLATRWLEACPGLTLYLVDRWKPAAPNSDYARIGDPAANADAEQHTEWYGETLSRMTAFAAGRSIIMHTEAATAAAALAFDDVALDAVFLDGDHSYNGRLADLAAWAPLVKFGGLVAGGLLCSSYGGHCGRDALHDYLATLRRHPTEIIKGPASTWAFFQEAP